MEKSIVISIAELTWAAKSKPSIKDEEISDDGHEGGGLTQNVHDNATGYQDQNNHSGDGDINLSQGGNQSVIGRGANIHHGPGTTGEPPAR